MNNDFFLLITSCFNFEGKFNYYWLMKPEYIRCFHAEFSELKCVAKKRRLLLKIQTFSKFFGL